MEDTVVDFQMQIPNGGCCVCGDFNEKSYDIDERKAGLYYKDGWYCKKCFIEEYGHRPDRE